MTKRVFLIHGWQGYPDEGWRPWLKRELEKRNVAVFVPAMPDTVRPQMESWVSHLAKTVRKPDKNCFFVGHSLGCIVILRYLETLKENKAVGGVIMFAGFTHDLEYGGYNRELASFFAKPINWQKLKQACPKYIAIHSDNDPWVSLKHNRILKRKLGAETIIMHNMKHFSGDDGIDKLPIALELLLRFGVIKLLQP